MKKYLTIIFLFCFINVLQGQTKVPTRLLYTNVDVASWGRVTTATLAVHNAVNIMSNNYVKNAMTNNYLKNAYSNSINLKIDTEYYERQILVVTTTNIANPVMVLSNQFTPANSGIYEISYYCSTTISNTNSNSATVRIMIVSNTKNILTNIAPPSKGRGVYGYLVNGWFSMSGRSIVWLPAASVIFKITFSATETRAYIKESNMIIRRIK